MSQRNVERIVGRLATDEGFRQRFQADRAALIEECIATGLELSPIERSALLRLDCPACERFAEALDPRIQKASLRQDEPPERHERDTWPDRDGPFPRRFR